jgi:hypothetical protein
VKGEGRREEYVWKGDGLMGGWMDGWMDSWMVAKVVDRRRFLKDVRCQYPIPTPIPCHISQVGQIDRIDPSQGD